MVSSVARLEKTNDPKGASVALHLIENAARPNLPILPTPRLHRADKTQMPGDQYSHSESLRADYLRLFFSPWYLTHFFRWLGPTI